MTHVVPRHCVVALDIGGTTIKAALVSPDGAVLHERRLPTPRERGPEAVIAAVLATAAELRSFARAVLGVSPAAVGVASLGLVNTDTGRAGWSTTLGWSNVPLADLVGERVDLPVVLVHDIGAAAAAEATRMSGGATANALFVGLGTGIGGCPIIEGQLLRGAHQRAGEIGHIAVCGADTPCGCGRSGCLETVASGRAIASAYRACARDDGPMTALEVAQAAERGDPVAAGVWTRACEALADGLATYSTLLDPGLVVLGGGLSLAGDRLLRPVRSHLATALALPGRPEVIAARFGDRGALHGAAIAARRLVGNTADPNLPSGDLPVAASPCGARPTPREPDGGCEA